MGLIVKHSVHLDGVEITDKQHLRNVALELVMRCIRRGRTVALTNGEMTTMASILTSDKHRQTFIDALTLEVPDELCPVLGVEHGTKIIGLSSQFASYRDQHSKVAMVLNVSVGKEHFNGIKDLHNGLIQILGKGIKLKKQDGNNALANIINNADQLLPILTAQLDKGAAEELGLEAGSIFQSIYPELKPQFEPSEEEWKQLQHHRV